MQSGRLGRIQKTIDEFLRNRGEWCWFYALVLAVFDRERPSRSGNPRLPPRSLEIAVLASVRRLEERELIHTGYVWNDLGEKELACWLPDQDPPMLIKDDSRLDIHAEWNVFESVASGMAQEQQRRLAEDNGDN